MPSTVRTMARAEQNLGRLMSRLLYRDTRQQRAALTAHAFAYAQAATAVASDFARVDVQDSGHVSRVSRWRDSAQQFRRQVMRRATSAKLADEYAQTVRAEETLFASLAKADPMRVHACLARFDREVSEQLRRALNPRQLKSPSVSARRTVAESA